MIEIAQDGARIVALAIAALLGCARTPAPRSEAAGGTCLPVVPLTFDFAGGLVELQPSGEFVRVDHGERKKAGMHVAKDVIRDPFGAERHCEGRTVFYGRSGHQVFGYFDDDDSFIIPSTAHRFAIDAEGNAKLYHLRDEPYTSFAWLTLVESIHVDGDLARARRTATLVVVLWAIYQ